MTTPKTERRWFRFNLRTMLVFVTLIAGLLGWFSSNMNQARKQREAVEAIGKVGGWVKYDYHYQTSRAGILKPVAPVWLRKRLGDDFFSRVVFATVLSDDGLKHLADLPRLQKVDLWHYESKVTDAGLQHLTRLHQLEELSLRATKITGAGLEHLKGLNQLRTLNLSQTKVTDAGLEHLNGMRQLQSLNLGYLAVTDAGLEHLKGLKQLQSLNLWATQVTDAGLEHLQGLKQLRSFDVNSRHVTQAGLMKLQQALPNCDIHPLSATKEPVPEQRQVVP